MSFGDAARHAIRCAREGIALHRHMKIYIERHAERIRNWPGNAECFLPDGRIPEVGDLFVQRDLAATLQYMADEEHAAAKGGRESGLAAARDAFYKGDIAQVMVAFQRENGGWLTADDLAGYASAVEPPVAYRYRGIDIYSCGPWCQGPVVPQRSPCLRESTWKHSVTTRPSTFTPSPRRSSSHSRTANAITGIHGSSTFRLGPCSIRTMPRSGESLSAPTKPGRSFPPAGSVNGGPDRWAAPAATRDAPTPVHAADTSYAAVIDGRRQCLLGDAERHELGRPGGAGARVHANPPEARNRSPFPDTRAASRLASGRV